MGKLYLLLLENEVEHHSQVAQLQSFLKPVGFSFSIRHTAGRQQRQAIICTLPMTESDGAGCRHGGTRADGAAQTEAL